MENMIAHLQSHLLGLVHLLTALAAMACGTAVIFAPKGTRKHRLLGRSYLLLMLAMNGTALLIYELFGRFGPFHWMVLVSLASVIGGYLAVWRKVPGWQFGPSVAISSIVVIFVGIWMMQRKIPRIIG